MYFRISDKESTAKETTEQEEIGSPPEGAKKSVEEEFVSRVDILTTDLTMPVPTPRTIQPIESSITSLDTSDQPQERSFCISNFPSYSLQMFCKFTQKFI